MTHRIAHLKVEIFEFFVDFITKQKSYKHSVYSFFYDFAGLLAEREGFSTGSFGEPPDL
jgi:hypothetical protein